METKKAGRPKKNETKEVKEVKVLKNMNEKNQEQAEPTWEEKANYFMGVAQQLNIENAQLKQHMNQINRIDILIDLLKTNTLTVEEEGKVKTEIFIALGYIKKEEKAE